MAVSSPKNVKYGGNTTCVQIQSGCLPPDMVFAIDVGTGIFPLSAKYIATHPHLVILQTHYHWDHLMGLPMAPHAHAESARVSVYGPEEDGGGPKEAMMDLFKKRYFPRLFGQIEHRFKCRSFLNPGLQVLVVHPKAGIHLLSTAKYLSAIGAHKQLQLGDQRRDASECLIVTMYKTDHPDFAVSYRVVENPTGSVFVFVTDHEKLADHPKDLLAHVRDADLLIQDGQYSEETYAVRTAGFGHGTPRYCVELAIRAGAKKLYLTHHDPMATDKDIDHNVSDARHFLRSVIEPLSLLEIGAAYDYMEMIV
ncbi:MAG: MBL fold metallo-hydrolase [Candidatus Paceibacterota bacterium]|jgi:ribonuclease BN (tRNA processing enzyme)